MQVCMLGCGLCTRSSAFELSPTMAAQTQRYRSKSSQSMCSLPVLCPCLSVLFMSSSAHTSARALLFHDFLPMSLSPRAPPCVRGRIVAQNRSLCFLPLRGSRFCLPPLVVLGSLRFPYRNAAHARWFLLRRSSNCSSECCWTRRPQNEGQIVAPSFAPKGRPPTVGGRLLGAKLGSGKWRPVGGHRPGWKPDSVLSRGRRQGCCRATPALPQRLKL